MIILFLLWAIALVSSYILIRGTYKIAQDERSYRRRQRHQREQKAFSYLWPYLRDADKDC